MLLKIDVCEHYTMSLQRGVAVLSANWEIGTAILGHRSPLTCEKCGYACSVTKVDLTALECEWAASATDSEKRYDQNVAGKLRKAAAQIRGAK